MGNKESKNIESYRHFIQNYRFFTNLRHPSFGDLTILEHKSKPDLRVIEKIFVMSDEGQFYQSIKLIELKLATRFPDYCQIKSFCSYYQYGCTNQNFHIRIAIEYVEKNLYQIGLQFSRPEQNMGIFLDETISWKILSSITQLAVSFKRYNLSIGEISPENVFVNAEQILELL